MSTTSAINLQNIPPPDIVEVLDFEQILSELIADYLARNPEHTALLESDPIYKEMEAFAYREMLLRQRVNNAARAVMLSSALGADLDQISANYDVARFPAADVQFNSSLGSGATAEAVIIEGVITSIVVQNQGTGYTVAPTISIISPSGTGATATAVVQGGKVVRVELTSGGSNYYQETDESLRTRTQLSLEGITTAGSEGGYLFHALSADARVKDVGVYGPELEPGKVYVTVQSNSGNGLASVDLVAKVASALNGQDVRPLTDQVITQSVTPVGFAISATLLFYDGPDRGTVLTKAREAISSYVQKLHRVGRDVPISGIYAQLHQEGVSRVVLANPVADLEIAYNECPYCTVTDWTTAIIDGGVGE